MSLSNQNFIIKRNDTLPVLKVNIYDQTYLTTKVPFNLTGATACTFSMTDKYGNYKIAGSEALILSTSGGMIQYEWKDLDTNEHGRFKGEFQLHYDGGKRLTIPQQGFIDIEITKDIVV